jgi:hypothetical protein
MAIQTVQTILTQATVVQAPHPMPTEHPLLQVGQSPMFSATEPLSLETKPTATVALSPNLKTAEACLSVLVLMQSRRCLLTGPSNTLANCTAQINDFM